jgi:hypothetical protein
MSYTLPTDLHQFGIWVFPVPVADLEKKFDRSLQQQPELEGVEGAKVGGGFGALGNASSFHTRFARKLRATVYGQLRTELQSHPDHSGRNLEVIPDRQSFRPVGQVPTAESWHRDLSPVGGAGLVQSQPDDLILGGWINCNSAAAQHFVCVPGSHQLNSVFTNKGFATIAKAEAAQWKSQSVSVAIPPGHCMVFNQSLVHCVNPTKLKFELKRLYVAYRVSDAATTVPLIPDVCDRLGRGAIVPLKSGQVPPMFPDLWLVNWPDKLIAFSNKFTAPEMKETRYIRSKRLREHDELADEGDHTIVKKHAPDVAPPVPYSAAEIALYMPHPIK